MKNLTRTAPSANRARERWDSESGKRNCRHVESKLLTCVVWNRIRFKKRKIKWEHFNKEDQCGQISNNLGLTPPAPPSACVCSADGPGFVAIILKKRFVKP